MKTVTDQFLGAQKRIGKCDASFHRVYLRNLATDERVEITKLLLEQGGLGVVTDEMERELHGYRSGDVSITCYNIAGGILQSKRDKPAVELAWLPASQQVAAHEAYEDVGDSFFLNSGGTGFFDNLTDKIQCEIFAGLNNCTDNIGQLEGLVVHDTVKRLDRDLIEFTVRSWDYELRDYNAEEVADTTVNPIKNITGLTIASMAEGGVSGVYKLKYRIDSGGVQWLQYDEGSEQELTGWPVGASYDLYNAFDAGHPKRQKVTVTVPDPLSDLPLENAEDTIVIIPGAAGNMQVGYWHENIHVKDMVETLYAKAGVTATDIKAKAIDRENANHIFTYFNAAARTATVNCIGHIGDDLFVFGVGDKLYRVKRQESESLTYDHIATVDAGTIQKVFIREGDVWLIIGNATAAEIYQYTVTETACTRVNKSVPADAPHYNQVMIHPTLNRIYFVYDNGTDSYYRYYDIATDTYSVATKVAANSTIPSNSGLAVSENSLLFWLLETSQHSLSRYNFVTNTLQKTPGAYYNPYVAMGYATDDEIFYARSVCSLGRKGFLYWRDAGISAWENPLSAGEEIAYMTLSGTYLYAFLTNTDIIKLSGTGRHLFATNFSYTPTAALTIFDTGKQYLFGVCHSDATHFLAWEYSCRVVPYLIRADFAGMNVKQALDECAKTFLCWHKRTGRYSARFYYRGYNVGEFTMGFGHYEEDAPIMQKWQHSYDAVRVTGIDGVWEAGNIAYDAKVLNISTRFIDHTIGQAIAQWHFNFFNSLVPRKLFLTKGIFLPQLEIGDKVVLTHEYTGEVYNALVWRREYLASDQAFKFQLLELFDDFAIEVVNQLVLKDDVLVMEG